MGSQSTHQLSHPTKHHNQINQLFPEKTKMKVSQVAAVLAVPASASAAPWKDGKKSWGGHWKGGWKNGHEEKCMDGPFEFTSTYSVVATPDQVVNSDNEFTGGLAGAKGYYEYGINSIGCMMGPYETGIVSNGQDTGAGFTVKQIEDNPSAFFTDVHSSLAVPGAVRAQLG